LGLQQEAPLGCHASLDKNQLDSGVNRKQATAAQCRDDHEQSPVLVNSSSQGIVVGDGQQ